MSTNYRQMSVAVVMKAFFLVCYDFVFEWFSCVQPLWRMSFCLLQGCFHFICSPLMHWMSLRYFSKQMKCQSLHSLAFLGLLCHFSTYFIFITYFFIFSTQCNFEH